MDDEPERTKRWEGGYERTWEVLKEDESGSLKASVEDILYKAKRKRIFEHHGQVRLGMMRHLYVVVDGSRTMEDQDLKPNRLACTLKLLEYFVEEYFDQNPISQVGIIVTKGKRAEKFTELSGTYHVILDESHYRELLRHHVSPPPATSGSESSLIRMGFPQHTITSLADQDAKPSFSMAHLENSNDPGLTLGGYFCPQCRAKYCELPVECKVCAIVKDAKEKSKTNMSTFVKLARTAFVWNVIFLLMIRCTAVQVAFTNILLLLPLCDIIHFNVTFCYIPMD
ncbi:hypothetical protein JD844_008718 [Phrynosoma platyrhinos]|uniref:Ssl1-like domain-containing protein n=1 Tax=Phrynosoma platyrhinos TaxID=52577 RepID=A0ABQ7TEJ3_PHRPL|nr:hypothetical protein JD844_008718 [Phrynosoma platyrhinos]